MEYSVTFNFRCVVIEKTDLKFETGTVKERRENFTIDTYFFVFKMVLLFRIFRFCVIFRQKSSNLRLTY